MVLAKYKPEPEEASEENPRIFFKREIPFFSVSDETRLIKTKLKKDEEFKLVFRDSKANEEAPFEVTFDSKTHTDFFDIDTLKLEGNA